MQKIMFAVTKGNLGGAQRYVYDLASKFSEDSYNVTAIMGEGDKLEKLLKKQNIKTYVIPNLKRDINIIKEVKSFLFLFNIIKKEKPDILHLNSSKIGILGGLCGRILKVKKIIFTAHGWAHTEDRPLYQKKLIKIIHIITVMLSHKTIAVSNEVKNQLPSKLIKNKIVVIHNGIKNINALSKKDARTILNNKCNLNLTDDDFVVGTISELHKNKGLEYAINAIKNINGVKFIIIGEGEEREKLSSLIKENKLENRVFLCGFLENAENIVSAFDIFLLSSIKEGFPYVILEAGSKAVPVIATNTGGVSEIITNNITGILIKPKSCKDIETAVKKLKKEYKLRESLGNALQQKILKDFTFEKMFKETKRVYNL